VRHAHARSNADDRINSVPPGEGLSGQGVEEALALREALADEPITLGGATRLARTQETLELALDGRDVPRIIVPGLDEIRFGSYEGGPLAAYRDWAWSTEPARLCPGGGESRAQAAARIAVALEDVLSRPEEVVLVVSHALPVRYVLDAADGRVPRPRITPVPHAATFALEGREVARAAATLAAWALEPRFSETRNHPIDSPDRAL
jgi:broad specificity phosphatase PhoE